MKNFIATYDIEPSPGEPQQRFLEAARERGWSATLDVAGQSELLPANTIIGAFTDLDDAHRAFDEALAAASKMAAPGKVSIDRRFIVQRIQAGRLQALRTRLVQTNIARLNKLLRGKS